MITILFLILAILFILILIPLATLINFLLQTRNAYKTAEVKSLSKVVFMVSFASFMLMLSEIVVIISTILGVKTGGAYLLGQLVFFAAIMCTVNWWAFFKIRNFVK